jgi:hypothetical protein
MRKGAHRTFEILRMASYLGHAAIDNQFGRVDEAAVIRGEKHDCLGDFIRFARAPQRDRGRHVGGEFLNLLCGVRQRVPEEAASRIRVLDGL